MRARTPSPVLGDYPFERASHFCASNFSNPSSYPRDRDHRDRDHHDGGGRPRGRRPLGDRYADRAQQVERFVVGFQGRPGRFRGVLAFAQPLRQTHGEPADQPVTEARAAPWPRIFLPLAISTMRCAASSCSSKTVVPQYVTVIGQTLIFTEPVTVLPS
ncbi:hypothetical protein [Streptomyces sp. SLBN-8D4]|uniref:hypothetical protein n=1 Tax=Streptomyces sp. SLBN-8D4 TaxID=3377728 RepID=UPI003C7E6F76